MYDLRGYVVHGEGLGKKEKDLTEENLDRIEDVLRDSLRRWIDNPDNFTQDALSELELS
jgi:hypothetical protein